MRKFWVQFVWLVTAVIALAGCTAAAEVVEVTRLVPQEVEVPVTVEVTRVVAEAFTVEVEVTRLVEVVATPTDEAPPTPTPETAPADEATAVPPEPTPIPTEAPAIAADGDYYTVQSGDTLSIIADKTGVAAADIMTANNLSNANVIVAGQQLLIPGWSGEVAAVPAPNQPADPAAPAAPTGVNLLPNPSFEEGWYFFNGVDEWQLPNGWSLSVDEGPNSLSPGSGGRFFRPEIRVLSRAHIPPAEQSMFLFDREHTIKAFKGDAPTNFAIFTDVALPAGTYRFGANFFADSVTGYDGSQKVFNGDQLSAEYRIIFNNGGTNWTPAPAGNRSSPTYEFTLTAPETVRLGVAFRNRYAQSNNGWFIDDWSLFALGE